MDPQACLLHLLRSLWQHETEDAQTAFDDLIEWHRNGGFTPDLKRALNDLTGYRS
jgi:hypothetical protein